MVVKKILFCSLIYATLILTSCDGQFFNWDLERVNPNDNQGAGSTSGTGGTSGSGGSSGATGTSGTGGGTVATILNDLNQIQFVDNNIAYVVGTGVVIKSVDGGVKWVKINTPNNLNFTAVYFVNASIGYLGGNDEYYSYIFRTLDGGLTWQQLNRYWFQNERNQVTGVFASNSGERIVAFINQYPNATQVYGNMVYSSNSGATWATMQANRRAGFNTADLTNENIFIGGNSYWTGTTYRTSVYMTSYLLNGTPNLIEYTLLNDMEPINFNQLDLVSDFLVGVTDKGQLAFSSNISRQDLSFKRFPGISPTQSVSLNAIAFYDKNIGYVGMPSGKIFKTEDSGSSWSPIFQATNEVTDLGLRPDGKVFIVGKRGLVRMIN
jgi:hypothetical protein